MNPGPFPRTGSFPARTFAPEPNRIDQTEARRAAAALGSQRLGRRTFKEAARPGRRSATGWAVEARRGRRSQVGSGQQPSRTLAEHVMNLSVGSTRDWTSRLRTFTPAHRSGRVRCNCGRGPGGGCPPDERARTAAPARPAPSACSRSPGRNFCRRGNCSTVGTPVTARSRTSTPPPDPSGAFPARFLPTIRPPRSLGAPPQDPQEAKIRRLKS